MGLRMQTASEGDDCLKGPFLPLVPMSRPLPQVIGPGLSVFDAWIKIAARYLRCGLVRVLLAPDVR